MQVEYPARLTSVRATGPFVRIEGTRGQNTWLHFPLPTPVVLDGVRMRIEGAYVSFRTRDHASVDEVIIYDGESRIAEHMNLDLRGEHLDHRVDVPGNPEFHGGINVTLGVRFDDTAPDVRSMQIEVIGVGLEYSGGD
ncbi:MAG: hypothetical protein BZY77_04385 [SAR202 cluster bacterium Io17-Chloro-G5]|nr:MAG: hypothetical protein BZY77_04385 [SAR202 cluster bacterium Io17-Chloro-G5]